jgi:hypothetical protein
VTEAGTYPITITGTAASGTHAITYNLTVTATSTGSGSLVNGGFETGSLSPWTCQTGDAVVTTPVHSGSYALQVTPTASQTGECDQTLTLTPNHSYTLTGWVQGSYAYLGVSGGATASTWASSSSWTVHHRRLRHRHGVRPRLVLAGERLRGRPGRELAVTAGPRVSRPGPAR